MQTLIFVALFLVLFVVVLVRLQNRPNSKDLLLVLGSGGHTSQLLLMIGKFNFERVDRVILVSAKSDLLSHNKALKRLESLNVAAEKIIVESIPRSRQVKQSLITTPFTIFYSLLFCFLFTFRYPTIKMIFSNGPGTAIPLMLSYWIRGKVGGFKVKQCFVESWCRTKHLSNSGKIGRLFSQKMVVLWQSLKKQGEYMQLI